MLTYGEGDSMNGPSLFSFAWILLEPHPGVFCSVPINKSWDSTGGGQKSGQAPCEVLPSQICLCSARAVAKTEALAY